MEANRKGKRPACVVSPPPPPPPLPPPLTEGEGEERMEKFYALLENLKAMRELWRTNPTNKRPRREEPLWQPTFVPEDFMGRDEAAVSPEGGGLDASKEGEQGKGKEKEEGGEVEDNLDLSLAL